MKDRTVIFDLGNVVLFFDHEVICRKLASLFNLDERFIFEKIFQDGIEKEFDEGKLSPEIFTQQCSDALNVSLNLSAFKYIWSDIFTKNTPVIEIIKELRARACVFLLSNTNIWHIEQVKNQFSVLELFDELILSFQVGYSKPHRKIFERAIELSSTPELIFYIDDIEAYVRAATELGIYGIHYTESSQLRSKLTSVGLL
jgi:putative hydrolase of the HAD superfamily